ncbi:hypothetical protein OAC90_00290 [Planktomarina sp.]|nr:hypothetical protein [Planktomarina sp.]
MECTICSGTGYSTDPGGSVPFKCGRCMTTGVEPTQKQLCINQMTQEILSITSCIDEGDYMDFDTGESHLSELISDRRLARSILALVSSEATDEMSFEEVRTIVENVGKKNDG